MNEEFKSLIRELLTDTYTRTVKDNEEDFTLVYYLIWKIGTMLVSKKIINMNELEEMLKIDGTKSEIEQEMRKWLEKIEIFS